MSKTLQILIFLAVLVLGLPASAQRGLSRETIEKFEALAQQALKDTGVPGMSIGIVKDGEVVYLKGFGIRSIDNPQPVTPDTVFQLASCSKPVTSTALAALVGDGLFDWNTTIASIDPGFRLNDDYVSERLTFRDLLSHRSGLPGFSGDLLEELGYTRPQVLAKLHYQQLENNFRSRYAYTNHGIGVAAVTGAKAAQETFESLVEKRVFAPLNMASSSARYSDFRKATNRAESHQIKEGRVTLGFVRQPDAQAPAGGVSSTARDMTKFLICHLNEGQFEGKQVIDKKALMTTHQPVIVTGVNPATFSKAGFYGLCWGQEFDQRGTLLVKHSGAFETGIRTQLVVLPEEDLGIVILSNAFPTGLPEGLSGALLDLYFEGQTDPGHVAEIDRAFKAGMAALLGEPLDLDQKPSKASPALLSEAYLGKFDNDYFGPVEVVKSGSQLSLRMGPEFSISAPLVHWDRDVFTCEYLSPTMGPVTTFVRFNINSQGQADELIVDELNSQGLRRFKKSR